MDEVKYSEDGKTLIRVSKDYEGEFVVPDGVTKIEWRAFNGCTGLTNIKIPNSVTKIGRSAFWGCTGLTSIEIPNSVTKIGWSAFEGCNGLKEIHIRIEYIEKIEMGENIFEGVDLSQVTLYVPVGTGYAYRHHPIFGKCKEVVIEK